MRATPVAVILFASACSTGAPRAPALMDRPHVTVAVVPELYDGSPLAVRVTLLGEQRNTRSVSSVVSMIEVKSANGVVPIEPQANPPEETYRGYEAQAYLLPPQLADGIYEVTVSLMDWGVTVGTRAAELKQDGLTFRTMFSYSQSHFEFQSVAVCENGLVTLTFGERLAPISPVAFLERVRIIASSGEVTCRVSDRSVTPENLVQGMPVDLECGQFGPPFSVVLNSLASETGRAPAIYVPGRTPVGEIVFERATTVQEDCALYQTRRFQGGSHQEAHGAGMESSRTGNSARCVSHLSGVRCGSRRGLSRRPLLHAIFAGFLHTTGRMRHGRRQSTSRL